MSKIILFPNVFLFSLRYFINTEQWYEMDEDIVLLPNSFSVNMDIN